jgi:hypothetical protein
MDILYLSAFGDRLQEYVGGAQGHQELRSAAKPVEKSGGGAQVPMKNTFTGSAGCRRSAYKSFT